MAIAIHPARQGIRPILFSIAVNLTLSVVKAVAGTVGHSYALIADAAESLSDVFSSLVVYIGLRVASRPPDADHPYGHGKAEPMAATVVALILFAVGVAIAIESVHEIITPH
ncbi:MAG TPA: cation diffusion facilitator family transporter, partial [Bryobacteraceae bacterium]|nr:cation diffusion facilitator family transporter [Bryobacteraceae bacterium]